MALGKSQLKTALTGAVCLAAVALGLSSPTAAVTPRGVDNTQLLRKADYLSVYPDMKDAFRTTGRFHLFAPHKCVDQGHVVRVARAHRIEGALSMEFEPGGVVLIEQNVVRLADVAAAQHLVRRYRHYGSACVGNEKTDDGEGHPVTLKVRTWDPPKIGQQSAGFLLGWFSQGGHDWRRVVAVRKGRTVSVIDVTFSEARPPATSLVTLGELSATKLR